MTTMNDFWKLLDFLKSGKTSDPTIDQNLTALAQSEKSKTSDYFEKILDVKPFLTADYGRLRKFLIDWYSSHKTLITTQKQITDIFSLPESVLGELIQSFGYTNLIESLTLNTKINFFLDLVDLYKIKGTPLAVDRILAYFGLGEIDLVEFWLERHESGVLIFKPVVVISSVINPLFRIPLPDIPFDEMVSRDPHWMLTKDQIEASLLVNAIGIPSISPYFSAYNYSDVTDLLKCIAALVRKIQDDYQTWKDTGKTKKEINLRLFAEGQTTLITYNISVLEVYLSIIYLYNSFRVVTGPDTSFLCYDGTAATDFSIISALYDSLVARTFTRAETKTKYESFMTDFTRVYTRNFLQTANTAGQKLKLINPSLYTELSSWTSTEDKATTIMIYFLNELTTWCRQNIYNLFPNLSPLFFGVSSSTEIINAINFFKPYRARFRPPTTVNIIKNPMADSLIMEDSEYEIVKETIVDFDTANCFPGVLPDWIPSGPYVTSTPLIGDRRILNLYVDGSFVVKAVSTDATSSISTNILSTPPTGSHRVTNVYLQDTINSGLKLEVVYDGTPEPVDGTSSIVVSIPPYSSIWPYEYLIYDMYIQSNDDIHITYSTSHTPGIDVNQRYYSRNTYDTGAYFDIGVSCDDPPTPLFITEILWLGEDYVRRIPREPDTWIDIPYYKDQYPEDSTGTTLFRPVVDHYCGHPTDASSYVDVYHPPGSYPEYLNGYPGPPFTNTGEGSEEWWTDGGFYNKFDEGGYFDQPFPSDVCYIVHAVELDVQSVDPSTNVPIEITRVDVHGNSNGNTELFRWYPINSTMVVSSPLVSGVNTFQKWQLDGVDYHSPDRQVPFLADDNHTLVAVFIPPFQLDVRSLNPSSNVPIQITELDVYGNSNGNTEFFRWYHINSTMTITAPSTFGGNPFLKWQLDGVDYHSPDRIVPFIADDNHILVAIFGIPVGPWYEEGSSGYFEVIGTQWIPLVGYLPSIPLGTAVNQPTWAWTSSGNALWFGQALINYDGLHAGQSGDISDLEQSNLETTVVGPGSLSFWWKVSSEGGFDFLKFYIDNVLQDSISGNPYPGPTLNDWQNKTYSILGAGPHTLKWQYMKDSSASVGSDAGWVDQVTFS